MNKKEKPTVVGLKRLLKEGQRWNCLWEAPKKPSKFLGVRELSYIDTVKFGFSTPSGEKSYADFPKADELTVLTDSKFVINKGWVQLTYTLVK